MQGLLHGCSPAMKMLTLPHPLQKIFPFAVIEVAVVSEEARHGVQAELFGNFGLLGDTGKQGKRLTFVSFSPTVQAIHKQFLPRDGFRHVATSSVSSHPTWQRRDLQAMKQHVKGESNAWKATFGRYRRACDPNSFGNTNVSPALLGRWRLLLVRGGSALVSKKGMLVAQMLKHQNLADSVRQYCGAGGQGFPVAALRPALGDRKSLSAFFGWLHVPWSCVRLEWGHIQVVQKFMYNDVIYGKDVSNLIESMFQKCSYTEAP